MDKRESKANRYLSGIKNRDKFQKHLHENQIATQIHYPIPPHLSDAYEYLGYKEGEFPLTEQYANTVISLPLYEGMTEEEIDYVVDVINRYGG